RKLDELAEVLAIDRVETLCPDAALVEQARVAQYPDVLRHAGPRQLEMPGDAASRHLPLAHQVHDLEARLVTQCLKFRKNGQLFVISVNYYLRKKFLTTRWPPSASCALIVSDLRGDENIGRRELAQSPQDGGPMTIAERFYSINYFKTERLV